VAEIHKPFSASDDATRHGEVESLATQVLSALAQRAGQTEASVDPGALAKFCANIVRSGPSIRTDSLDALRRHGVDMAGVLDSYIPAAARELGERWCRDELSFADVTIGASRLQAILREMSASPMACPVTGTEAANVMLIVPHDEYHTLGGMAAASQMRRMGLSVCLCLGQTEEELLQKAATRDFDMVAVSLSCRDKLGAVRRLIDALRRTLRPDVPIMIGGRVVGEVDDIRGASGADIATSDPREALRLCGVKLPGMNGLERAGRG